MGKAVKALVGVLVFAAAAGAAEDEVKIEKSKPIVYYGPETPLSQFGCDLVKIGNRYQLKWPISFDDDMAVQLYAPAPRY